MSLRNIIKLLLFVPLGAYFLYCCFHVVFDEFHPSYLDCGTVVSKSNDEVVIKHGSRTELYLNVNFEKTGFRSIETTPTTYFSKKVGDKVCFRINENVSFWYGTNHIIGLMIITILLFIGLFFLIDYLFPNLFE